jgi:hypothetical protein
VDEQGAHQACVVEQQHLRKAVARRTELQESGRGRLELHVQATHCASLFRRAGVRHRHKAGPGTPCLSGRTLPRLDVRVCACFMLPVAAPPDAAPSAAVHGLQLL